jgi:hypothetical protein
LEDPGVDGKILLKWIYKKWVGVRGLNLAQDKDRWRAAVSTVMNIWGAIKGGGFLD